MKMSTPIDLPPGFRFHPTDEELIIHYLKKKVSSSSPNPMVSIIADIDLYKFNPWDLPDKAMFGESEWFFFSPRDRKYPNGVRPNRAAASGYWKATGTDKPILSSIGSQCVGVKKALVFYKGRPPKGLKTNWMMYEYRLLNDSGYLPRFGGSMRLDDWVLCRIREKSTFPAQKKDNNETRKRSFSPSDFETFEEKDIMEKINYFKSYELGSQGSEVLNEQLCFQGGSMEGLFSDVNSDDFQVHTMKDALESIKRVLSIGAFDEQLPILPPNKRLCSLASNNNHNINNLESKEIFEISSYYSL